MSDSHNWPPWVQTNGTKRECEVPYEAAFFAEKHGLTLRAAQIILTSNGPSRQRCDAAARAFVTAVAARAKGTSAYERHLRSSLSVYTVGDVIEN
jgi:hypothetical protein